MPSYHGTLAGEEILKSGYIHTTNKENSVYGINESSDNSISLQTSMGYIYLTLYEEKACEFAWAAMVHGGKALTGATIYIFEVEVTGMQLHPDYDEFGSKEVSLSEAIRETKTFAVSNSLKLGERINRYKEIKVSSSNELSEIIDQGKLSEYEWIDL